MASSFIPQQFSWGRFCVSQATFEAILDAHGVFSPFLSLLDAYGIKIAEDGCCGKGSRMHVAYNPDLDQVQGMLPRPAV